LSELLRLALNATLVPPVVHANRIFIFWLLRITLLILVFSLSIAFLHAVKLTAFLNAVK